MTKNDIHWWVTLVLRARAGSLKGRTKGQSSIGLVPAHWWVGLVPGSLAGSLGSGTSTMVCRDRPCGNTLWWAGDLSRGYCGLRGFKTACLLVGGLCSCPVICLPSCVLELAPIDVEPADRGFLNGICKHQCPCGRKSSPEWLPPVSMSPGGVAVAPASLGDSPKSVGESDPASYSCFCPGPCESGELLFLPALWDSQLYALLAFKSQMLWGLVFVVQDPWTGGVWCGARCPTSFERASAPVILLFEMPTQGYKTGQYHDVCPTILLWFHLYSFSCRRSALVSVSLFHWWPFWK